MLEPKDDADAGIGSRLSVFEIRNFRANWFALIVLFNSFADA